MTLIAAIHVAKRDLSMEEQDYRSLLERVTGKASLRQMNSVEHIRVLDELRAKGAPTLLVKGKELPGPYAKKLQALWIAGWNLGVIHNRTDAAMLTFIKGQTGVEHTRFLRDPADARKAVEALKSWLRRDAGVMFGNTNGHDWLASEPAKIAWAQWKLLEPGSALHPLDMPFYCFVLQITDSASGSSLESLKPAQWRTVMNALGKRIRKAAGA